MEKELELLSGVIEEKQLKELVNNDVNGEHGVQLHQLHLQLQFQC